MNASIRLGLIVAGSSFAPLHLAVGDLPARAPQVDERYLFSEQQLCTRVLKSEFFARTELLFGLSRSGGPDITEQEFEHFIDTKVTPRFPDGLTVLSGNGQFKNASGTIVEEGSKLLILLYPFNLQASRLVEDIRRDYKELFQQESVLRIDDLSCVSF
ncbi:MAG TPA: DUF3574 domain-containing protein [Steroidobacter sp.]|uniref:DUF3574 domain-containing protein n=1 Tax=Steroidobacter sp. TaxID=1978227 RepID=UPI002ED9B99C